MTEERFLEFIEAICRRPKLYTPTGSFYEIVSFLEGLSSGDRVENNAYHSVFTPFLHWIAEKHGLEKITFHWENVRKMYSSESEALKNLPILYKEFSESF
jgi:hypothetical protein